MVNPLPPEDCKKNAFLDIFGIFRLVMSQTTPNLLKTALFLQHEGMPFFPLASHFMTFSVGQLQKSNFGDCGWTRTYEPFPYL